MKRIARYSVIIMSIILFSGCNEKTEKLNCTTTISSYENLALQESLDITFKGNKVTKVSIYSEYELSGTYINLADELAVAIKEPYAGLEGKKGITFKTNQTENILSVTIDANLKEMDSEAKDALGIGSIYQSFKDVKEELESEGYTCH